MLTSRDSSYASEGISCSLTDYHKHKHSVLIGEHGALFPGVVMHINKNVTDDLVDFFK